MVPFEYYVTLSLILFVIGLAGVLFRRNIIILLASLEIIMNALIVLFAAISFHAKDISGYLIVFFLIGMAAAEAGVGLSLAVLLYKKLKKVYVDEINFYRG
ncbi:MAG: NADH-quinone oxidoreductase subunit NuoK [Caldimicrobium sp.]|uniref:NADH-quinone oxidoreductase subunit K n=1 Tax=Caldimicrobium thiodismutans TaxID=1653476 RepID=A0A2N7PKW4_9BACT|nr:MAG: NADH-quinone oxidoreductase subunit NuoK [Caldimicrobium thiodismutans]